MAIKTVCTEIESLIYSAFSVMKQMLHLWGTECQSFLGSWSSISWSRNSSMFMEIKCWLPFHKDTSMDNHFARYNSEWNLRAYELFDNI